jgi:hypothetical protein
MNHSKTVLIRRVNQQTLLLPASHLLAFECIAVNCVLRLAAVYVNRCHVEHNSDPFQGGQSSS